MTTTSASIPAIGSTWKHPNTTVYKVIAITNEHADENRVLDHPIRVVYQDTHNGKVWDKLLSEWHDKMIELR